MSTASDRKRQATLSFSGQGVRLAEDPQPKRKRVPKAKDTRPTKQAAFAWGRSSQTLPLEDAGVDGKRAAASDNTMANEAAAIIDDASKTSESAFAWDRASTTMPLQHAAVDSKRAAASDNTMANEAGAIIDVASTTQHLDVWVDEDDRVMLVQDVTRADNVKDTWAGGEHGAILLDDGDYLDTNDMTPDEIAAWATHMDTENTACINVPSEARLAAVRAEVLQALAMMTCGAREFLEETEYGLEYGQDTFNMPGLFQSFKKEEARRSGMVESHIVSPSGYATSLLHLQLHYPTFTTKHLNDGQTLDATNCCIRILIEKGFVASNTYWFEAYFRRLSAASVRHLANVADGWKEEVKQLHDEFAYRCQSLSKKALLVFGAFSRKRFHERHNVENITVRLSCGSTTLMGIVRNNAQKILFVVVYAWHPEYLLRNRTTAVGRQYDAALNIAAALSGVDTKAGYFEARAARTHEKSRRSPTQSKSTISQPPPSLALVTATERERERKNRANEAEALKKEPTQKTLRYRRTENHTRDVPLHIYRLSGLAIILTARLDDAFRQRGYKQCYSVFCTLKQLPAVYNGLLRVHRTMPGTWSTS
ncbi:uncharacterized protein J4E88_003581 [Alternaria novae-zelandiae]|uniref:uncharacterized protein n=1 Tax=Alternaria novae-zelandiae TaxID=430562 RepID=UPI0020C4A98C|nr:uncharacterized protein J4E88_003581 [Alternaria novae-zelandiae]KAI4685745.1 hypothetical protein J4E88_003581 [Alternaria novae-zelandiae]